MSIRLISFALLLIAAPVFSAEFSYDDCILAGMKGVSTPYAATMVRTACENKRYEALDRQYGAKLNSHPVEISEVAGMADGIATVYASNRSRNTTVTYLRLSVLLGYDQLLLGHDSPDFAYKLLLKPGNKMALTFPLQGQTKPRVFVQQVRGRESKWNDFSIASSASPMSSDPVPVPLPVFYAPKAEAPVVAPSPSYMPSDDSAAYPKKHRKTQPTS